MCLIVRNFDPCEGKRGVGGFSGELLALQVLNAVQSGFYEVEDVDIVEAVVDGLAAETREANELRVVLLRHFHQRLQEM